MNKYNWAIFVACLMAVGQFSSAQIVTPRYADGKTATALDAPCVPFRINTTTGTAEVQVRGTPALTGNTVTTLTPGYLNWIMLSTGAVTAYLDVVDTDKLGSGQKYSMLPPVMFQGDLATALVSGGNIDTGKSPLITFSPPVKFSNGLTVKMSAAGAGATICTQAYGTPGR